VSQPQNVVTAGATAAAKPYSVLNSPLAVAGGESLTVGPNLTVNPTPTVFPAGRSAGFLIAAPNALLTANLLQGVSIATFLAGQPADGPVTLASGNVGAGLITVPVGSISAGYLSFQTTRPFDAVEIRNNGVLSLIGQLDVYEACVTNR